MERKGRQEHITKVIFDMLNNAREKCEYSLVVDNAVSCEINYCPMCGRKLEA